MDNSQIFKNIKDLLDEFAIHDIYRDDNNAVMTDDQIIQHLRTSGLSVREPRIYPSPQCDRERKLLYIFGVNNIENYRSFYRRIQHPQGTEIATINFEIKALKERMDNYLQSGKCRNRGALIRFLDKAGQIVELTKPSLDLKLLPSRLEELRATLTTNLQDRLNEIRLNVGTIITQEEFETFIQEIGLSGILERGEIKRDLITDDLITLPCCIQSDSTNTVFEYSTLRELAIRSYPNQPQHPLTRSQFDYNEIIPSPVLDLFARFEQDIQNKKIRLSKVITGVALEIREQEQRAASFLNEPFLAKTCVGHTKMLLDKKSLTESKIDAFSETLNTVTEKEKPLLRRPLMDADDGRYVVRLSANGRYDVRDRHDLLARRFSSEKASLPLSRKLPPHQSFTYYDPQDCNYTPGFFGRHHALDITGLRFSVNGVLVNRIITRDVGTWQRIYAFRNLSEANNFADYANNAWATSFEDLKQKQVISTKSGHDYNEVMARVSWKCDQSSQVVVYTNTLLAKFEAICRALIIEERLESNPELYRQKPYDWYEGYQVPISFWGNGRDGELKLYTKAQQEADISENILLAAVAARNFQCNKLFDFIQKNFFAQVSATISQKVLDLKTEPELIALLHILTNESIDNAQQKVVIEAVKLQLFNIIKSADVFKRVHGILGAKQRRVFFQIILSIFSQMLESVDDFPSIFYGLNDEEGQIFFEAIKDHLLSLVKSGYNIGKILSVLSVVQCQQICQILKPYLPTISNFSNSIWWVLKDLDTEKRAVVFLSIKEYLPSKIKSATDLGLTLVHLNPDDFNIVWQEMRPSLFNIIKSSKDLANFLKRLNINQRQLVFSVFTSHLPKMINSAADFKTLLGFLDDLQSRQVFYIMQKYIHGLIKTYQDFVDIIVYLPAKERRIICDAWCKKLSTIFESDEQLRNTLSPLPYEARKTLLTVLQIRNLNYILYKIGSITFGVILVGSIVAFIVTPSTVIAVGIMAGEILSAIGAFAVSCFTTATLSNFTTSVIGGLIVTGCSAVISYGGYKLAQGIATENNSWDINEMKNYTLKP